MRRAFDEAITAFNEPNALLPEPQFIYDEQYRIVGIRFASEVGDKT